MAEKLTMNKSSAELGWKLTKYVEDEGGGGGVSHIREEEKVEQDEKWKL